MGWQGRLRSIKAEKYFSMLPDDIKRDSKLYCAKVWRSGFRVWVFVAHKDGRKVAYCMNRKTCKIEGRINWY